MKYIQNFESFHNEEELYEFMGGVRKFVTGHESKEDLEKAKQKIYDEIENAIEKYNNNPDAFRAQNIEDLRKNLIESAKRNNYRGSISIRKSVGDIRTKGYGKYYIVYNPKSSGLEELGGAAGSATLKYQT